MGGSARMGSARKGSARARGSNATGFGMLGMMSGGSARARGSARGSTKESSDAVQATLARHLKKNRVTKLDALPKDELVTAELALLRVERADKDDAGAAQFNPFGGIGALLGTQTAAQGPDSRWLALVYPLSDEQTRTEDFPMLLTLSSDG